MKPTLHATSIKRAHNANDGNLRAGRANLRVSRLISRLGRNLALPLGILLLAMPGKAICGDSENLLKNAGPEQFGSGEKVPGWQFQKGEEETPGDIEAGVQEELEAFFFIKKTLDSSNTHVWWRQDVSLDVETPPTYELTFEAKGSGEMNYDIYAGVHYVGSDESFDFRRLATIARDDESGGKVVPPTDWREFRATFTPPPGTAKLVMKFALGGKSPSECGFRKFVLTELK